VPAKRDANAASGRRKPLLYPLNSFAATTHVLAATRLRHDNNDVIGDTCPVANARPEHRAKVRTETPVATAGRLGKETDDAAAWIAGNLHPMHWQSPVTAAELPAPVQ